MMIPVVCAIIVDKKRVLVTQRSAYKTLPLKWEFPGGKMNRDEGELACLKRELLEELRIMPEIGERLGEIVHSYDFGTIRLIAYIVYYNKEDVILIEHNDARWVEVGQLAELDWAPADLPILEMFIRWYCQA